MPKYFNEWFNSMHYLLLTLPAWQFDIIRFIDMTRWFQLMMKIRETYSHNKSKLDGSTILYHVWPIRFAFLLWKDTWTPRDIFQVTYWIKYPVSFLYPLNTSSLVQDDPPPDPIEYPRSWSTLLWFICRYLSAETTSHVLVVYQFVTWHRQRGRGRGAITVPMRQCFYQDDEKETGPVGRQLAK